MLQKLYRHSPTRHGASPMSISNGLISVAYLSVDVSSVSALALERADHLFMNALSFHLVPPSTLSQRAWNTPRFPRSVREVPSYPFPIRSRTRSMTSCLEWTPSFA